MSRAPILRRAGARVWSFVGDEHMRPDTSLEALAKVPARFRKDGTVTAGNASGFVDGAAMVIVTTKESRGTGPQPSRAPGRMGDRRS